MTYTITIHEESPQSLALLELLKTFDFVSIKKNKKKEAALSLEELEEDEDGIPIKYRDEIMAISKKVNKAVAKRWDAELSKRIEKDAI